MLDLSEVNLNSEYSNARYLKGYTDSEIKERWENLIINHIQLSKEGSLLLPNNKLESHWIKLLCDLYTECTARNKLDLLSIQDVEDNFNKRFPRAREAVALFNSINLIPGTFLVKFGEKKFIDQLLSDGSVYMKRASKFNEKELNTFGQYDDELSIERNWDGGKLMIKMGNGKYEEIPDTSRVRHKNRWSINPLVYCISTQLSPLMFDAFGADSCAIIPFGDRFRLEMENVFKKHFAKYSWRTGHISYFDRGGPNGTPPQDGISMLFEKDIAFQYQAEFRFAMWGEDMEPNQEWQILEFGKLPDSVIQLNL